METTAKKRPATKMNTADFPLESLSIEILNPEVKMLLQNLAKMHLIHIIKTKPTLGEPCKMTVEELRNEVVESIEDVRKGLGVSIENARAKHPRMV